MESVPIRMDRRWLNDFLERVETDSGWSTWERFRLALEAAEAQQIPDFDTLRSLGLLQGVTPFPIRWKPPAAYWGKCAGVPSWRMKSVWGKR